MTALTTKDSHIVLRFLAAPMDITYGGTVHGGKLLEWIDKAGYACAAGWSGRYCVTVYVGDVRFTRPVAIGEIQEGTAFTSRLIQDASFVRFRELSLTYTLPQRLAAGARASAASLTLAGRNLYTWTNYPGLEPEASFNGGARGGAFGQWEQNVLPQTRSFVTSINLSF